jgi:hypothetical protein
VLEVGVLPAEERRERDDDGHGPDQHHHGAHSPQVPALDVVHVRHRPVPENKKNISATEFKVQLKSRI